MEKTDYPQKASSFGTKLCYAAGDIGCNFVWTFVSGFLMLYYTDSIGISAAFIGTMLFICRVFDGGSDIAMGFIIEKTHTRWGKARLWILFSCMPLAVSLLLIFNVPGTLSEAGKQIYIYITYILMTVICYTAANLSYNAMLPRFSLTSHDRNIVSAIKGLAVIIAALVISILTPFLLEAFGGQQSQSAWRMISGIYAAIGLVMLLITFFGVKEKIPPNMDSDGKPVQIPMKKALSILLRNKYFYLATALFVVFYAITGTGGVTIYFARDVMGDANLFGLISAVAIFPMLIGIPILPALYKKIRQEKYHAAWNAGNNNRLRSAAYQSFQSDVLPGICSCPRFWKYYVFTSYFYSCQRYCGIGRATPRNAHRRLSYKRQQLWYKSWYRTGFSDGRMASHSG